MTEHTIHGSGLAIQTALNLLRNYAAHAGVTLEQAGRVRWCITQAEKDWNALRKQRDDARDAAASFEHELHRLESMYHAVRDEGGVVR